MPAAIKLATGIRCFPGTGVVNHPSAQSKLSREHLLKRSTQKPLSQQENMLTPRREGLSIRFPRFQYLATELEGVLFIHR